jgi:hypothetical protein
LEQALLDQYDGPAVPSMGVFATVLAGSELRRTSVVPVHSGVAKFNDDDDFCVYLPEGQQWRSSSSIKVVLMGSAQQPVNGQFQGKFGTCRIARKNLLTRFQQAAASYWLRAVCSWANISRLGRAASWLELRRSYALLVLLLSKWLLRFGLNHHTPKLR